jgi:SAM-dependent methyltransferase
MYDDVIDLRDFYAGSLGQVVRRHVRRRIRAIWPNTTGMTLLGLGYATPFLRPFREEAARVIAVMPATQGALRWPDTSKGEPNLVTLAHAAELPLPDMSVDRVLILHALERSEELRLMLREVWRVLAGNGRLLVVVPNRRGIWARLDRTPFGTGSPYTPVQLSRLLRDSLFTPLQSAHCLYVPPSNSRMVLSSAPAWEQLGQRWFPTFGGVLMLEATKQIYAATPMRAPSRGRTSLMPATDQARPHLPLSQGDEPR